MLMLPFINTSFEGSLLALFNTLAGNLFIVGSIANLIVIGLAADHGIATEYSKFQCWRLSHFTPSQVFLPRMLVRER